MYCCWIHIYILLSIIGSVFSIAPACRAGLFGPLCMFKCRCASSGNCNSQGTCLNNAACAKGYFGPACQFDDLLKRYVNTRLTPMYIHDLIASRTSCNIAAKSRPMVIYLVEKVKFSWIRIIALDPQQITNFSTLLDDVSCILERKFLLNSKTVDVTCDVNPLFLKLEIRGGITESVCSVYISGGRNVALGQQSTYQSSTLNTELGEEKLYWSHNAVDGNIDPNPRSGSCAATAFQYHAGSPEWKVEFNFPAVLRLINIYNQQDHQFRLHHANLTLISKTGQVLLSTDLRDIKTVRHIVITDENPVFTLRIIQSPNLSVYNRSMTLCEVEAFGESICPEHTYGLWCSERCECKHGEVCNSLTGACAGGCENGFYGINCSGVCSVTCVNNVCHNRNGHCYNCPPGYTGPFCNQECDKSFHGLNCAFLCSPNCARSCNHIDGKCIECTDGFFGPYCYYTCSSNCNSRCAKADGKCLNCNRGLYGDYCEKSCAANCHENLCNMSTGACYTCIGKYIGDKCEECAAMHYGKHCENTCSPHCLNRTCDSKLGTCDVCSDGYQGRMCMHVTPQSVPVWIFVIGAVALLLIIMMCLRGVRSRKVATEGSKIIAATTSVQYE